LRQRGHADIGFVHASKVAPPGERTHPILADLLLGQRFGDRLFEVVAP
jgi:hypothetical protein